MVNLAFVVAVGRSERYLNTAIATLRATKRYMRSVGSYQRAIQNVARKVQVHTLVRTSSPLIALPEVTATRVLVRRRPLPSVSVAHPISYRLVIRVVSQSCSLHAGVCVERARHIRDELISRASPSKVTTDVEVSRVADRGHSVRSMHSFFGGLIASEAPLLATCKASLSVENTV